MFSITPRRLALALFCASLVLAIAASAVCVAFGDSAAVCVAFGDSAIPWPTSAAATLSAPLPCPVV